MESFFEFIFANLFIVIIIVAAIINFVNRSKREDKKQERMPQRPNRPTMPESRRENIPRTESTVRKAKQVMERTPQAVTKSIEERSEERRVGKECETE